MKKIIISLINIYQNYISLLLRHLFGVNFVCRYDVTCSEYIKKSIKHQGILKGLRLGILRLLSCQPLENPFRSLPSLFKLKGIKYK